MDNRNYAFSSTTQRLRQLQVPPIAVAIANVMQRTKSVRQHAYQIEAAFHEAGHAVVALLLGGLIRKLRVHQKKSAQTEHEELGSVYFCEMPDADLACAILAGPAAAEIITSYFVVGDDYWNAEHVLKGNGISIDQQLVRTRELVRQHWPAIEYVARLLMKTKRRNGYPDWFNHAEIQPMLNMGNASPHETILHIPQEVRERWGTDEESRLKRKKRAEDREMRDERRWRALCKDWK